MITFLPHDLPETESVVPLMHHTCLPSVQGYQEVSDNYRRNTTVHMRKQTKDERKSDRDRLGFNSHQYVHEILIPHLQPLYKKAGGAQACGAEAGGAEAGVQTIEDGASYHTSIYREKYRKGLGIERMDRPSYSPDFNLIENVWLLFKTNYRKAV